MKSRKLGNLEVSSVGYGCMGLSGGYGDTPTKEEAVKTIRAAYDMGCTLFNTAEFYVMDTVNEELVGEALKDIRSKTAISTKFLITEKPEDKSIEQVLRSRLEASLKRLDTDHIDLYTQARVNKDIPLEDLAHCMGKFIEEGKILGWGLSQATAQQIKKSHAVTPLTAIESEYSMMERTFEKEVIPFCEENNIGFLAFSPLANGFLSGKIDANTEYEGVDARKVITRFDKENIIANQPLVSLLNKFAEEKEATPAQISLAWILHKKDFIVPIPGSRKLHRIEENLGAADVSLTDEEFNQLETELSKIEIHGDRKDEDLEKLNVNVHE